MKTICVSDIIARLKQFLNVHSDTELANVLDVKKSTISNWKNRNAIDLQLVFSKCEHANINWLLYGDNDISEITNTTKKTIHNSLKESRPRIPLDAAAGALSLITESVTEEQCERFPVIPNFPSYNFTIIVKGDSMEPEFHSGDEIACRFIVEPSFIQWGRPHVLDTTQGIVLKRIYNRKDSILCKSDNTDYEEFEIPKEDILHIAIVVGSIRLY